ncbi:MAG: cyclic nucleotide-binding domain-containing protein [Elusimicrobiota bacterium]|jgi:PAS domain S-box-containing protein
MILPGPRGGQAGREHRLPSSILEAVLDALGQAVVAADRDGRVLYANAAACEVSGWRPEELVGRTVHATLCRPFKLASAAGALERRREGSASKGLWVEGSFSRRSGETFPVECAVTRLGLEDSPDGVVLAFIDISEKLRLREQYLRAQKMEPLSGPAGRVRGALGAGILERRPVEPKDVAWLTQGMRNVGFLSSLGRAQLGKVLTCMTLLRYDRQVRIFGEGDPGDGLYLLRRGSVAVTRRGWAENVAVLEEGEFFGEMSLIFDEPRLATITTREMTEAYRLSGEDFRSILGRIPEMVGTLKKLAEGRLRQLVRS